LPSNARSDQVTPVPYIADLDNVTIAYICLFRRTRRDGGVALVIQYTVKIGGYVVASFVRNSHDPMYAMLHFRRESLADDLQLLKTKITAPPAFREMTRSEAETFAAEDTRLSKKQIRILPPKER